MATATTSDSTAVDVLVCGAGPTGLVLALRLVRAGLRIRIVDAAPEPGTASRALVVHARTLEFYRQMGFAGEFVNEGLRFDAANLWVRGRRVAHVKLGEIGQGMSAFPFMLVVPQDRHERFLIGKLEGEGVKVERGIELLDFEQGVDSVVARLRNRDGSEVKIEAAYLAGCDGARSRTRDVLRVGFPGDTYSHVFYVADVDADGPVMNDELHVALDESDFAAVFPLRGRRTGRIIGTVRLRDDAGAAHLTWGDVSKAPMERLDIGVERVNGFSTYQVHHRVAGRYQVGRVFLLGDAAHIHSPVGAQGMNTGIGDAVNLAWRLSDVLTRGVKDEILSTYATERMAFARRLVATTDRAFVFATSPGRFARFVRTRVVPLVLPLLTRQTFIRRFMFRVLSQTSIHYRGIDGCEGVAGQVHGGDRLPWVSFGDHASPPDNYSVLDGIHWQVHVYGESPEEWASACRDLSLTLHVFPWIAALSTSGLARNALYLVRPDAHVAFANDGIELDAFRRYVAAKRARAMAPAPS